jgi:hypothetical protein
MSESGHAHPTEFHLARWLDRGWGELACEYRWSSTIGEVCDLEHCRIYEVIRYKDNGLTESGWHTAPNPPFVDWRFRNPTDGRSAPVGLECFPASQGWAWDRHKLFGRLELPQHPAVYNVQGMQEYRFACDLCGMEELIPGSHSGPHEILRTFSPCTKGLWRYSLVKHGLTAWMDLDSDGYVADSANIGFGPW